MITGLGIVCSGGGMRCAYSAGFLKALHDEYGIDTPEILVASSGSAGNAFYYLAGQYAYLEDAWKQYLGRKQFISFKRHPIIDINYLVDKVLELQLPLDREALAANTTQYYIALANVMDGNTIYADRAFTDNPLEIVRASAAIPIVFNSKIAIEGLTYVDGDVGADICSHIQKAIDEGADCVLAIDNQSPRSPLADMFMWAYSLTLRRPFAKMIRRAARRTNERCATLDDPRVFHVQPRSPLSAKLLTRNRKKLAQTFDVGYYDAKSTPELADILTKFARKQSCPTDQQEA